MIKPRETAARRSSVIALIALFTIIGACMGGCASTQSGPSGPIFFPAPPDPPHIQYLTGISDSNDIEGEKSSFSLVITGGEQGRSVRRIGKAYGLTAQSGKLYVSALSTGQVIIIDFAKKKFDYLKGNTARGSLKKPANVAIDPEGNMYVADTGRKEIVVYDPAGNYLKSFGKGLGDVSIVAVEVYGQYLYAADNRTNMLRVLDRKTGEQVQTFGGADNPDTALAMPTGMALDADGFIYVTNIGANNVMKFDRDGHLLNKFGKAGDSYSEFSRPRSVALDHEGRMYVVDGGHQNVQVFDKSGRLLTFFGNPDPELPAGASLNLPAGIAVSSDNLDYFQKFAAPGFKLETIIYVINQYGRPTISVFGLGLMEGMKYEDANRSGAPQKK
jgi:DNA-binding beta-propeller fold protein YncE